MPTSYPGALDTTTNLPTTIADATTQATNHPAYHNTADGALIALQTKVGIGASTPTLNKVLTGGATPGTSSWVAPSQVRSKTALLIQPTGTFPLILPVWRVTAGNGVTVTAIYARREGGSTATINASKTVPGGTASLFLASDYSVPAPSPNPWQAAPAVVGGAACTLAPGDSMDVLFQSVIGTVGLVEIQIDYTEL